MSLNQRKKLLLREGRLKDGVVNMGGSCLIVDGRIEEFLFLSHEAQFYDNFFLLHFLIWYCCLTTKHRGNDIQCPLCEGT